ncbi:hypothetical protein SBDP1_850076 [Syntrophobacter sp. SbD1]|nr:hypothetical protein SBDP1_850076 [Syntrophobacter sp. SbD1]
MGEIVYFPIGIIRSPFRTVEGTPIQPAGASGVRGRIELRDFSYFGSYLNKSIALSPRSSSNRRF